MPKEIVNSLLVEALQLEKGDRLLIIYQDDYHLLKDFILNEAESANLSTSLIAFERERFVLGNFLDSHDLESDIQGIILLCDRTKAITKERLNLLRILKNLGRSWRIASMPGVDLAKLRKNNGKVDFRDIESISKEVFFALAISKSIRIYTKKPNEGWDLLELPIGSNVPILSTGKIPSGSWGNFPSGECFILPKKHKGEGVVTLRGSIPFHVMGKDEWVRFKVRKGRILFESIEASGSQLKQKFCSLFFSPRGKLLSKNGNCISEIGIGTNREIHELTGLPIFDEKKLGTFHLGIGRNDQFNGPIVSNSHDDIVFADYAKLTCVLSAYPVEIPIVKDKSYRLKTHFNISTIANYPLIAIPKILRRSGIDIEILNGKMIFEFETLRDSKVKVQVEDLPDSHLELVGKIMAFNSTQNELHYSEVVGQFSRVHKLSEIDLSLKTLILTEYFI